MATVEQIQKELDTWREEQGYYKTPEAVASELWTWNDNVKSFEIPSGTVTSVEDFGGGEGEGSERYIVFKVGDQFFQYNGYYSSWDGTEWDGELYEVEPYEVSVTKYRVKKEN